MNDFYTLYRLLIAHCQLLHYFITAPSFSFFVSRL